MEKENLKKIMNIPIPDITINPTDIGILMNCFKENPHYSISELARFLRINYKNLLPHIKKLEKYEFIKVINKGKGKRKEIVTNYKDNRVWAFLSLMQINKKDLEKLKWK